MTVGILGGGLAVAAYLDHDSEIVEANAEALAMMVGPWRSSAASTVSRATRRMAPSSQPVLTVK